MCDKKRCVFRTSEHARPPVAHPPAPCFVRLRLRAGVGSVPNTVLLVSSTYWHVTVSIGSMPFQSCDNVMMGVVDAFSIV